MTRNLNASWPLSLRDGLFILAVLVLLACESPIFAQASGSPMPSALDSVSNSDLRRKLRKPIGVTWERVPLREALDRLSTQSRIPIFLDRNVDPNLRITLQAKSAPFKTIVEKLAASLKLGVARVGPVVYLGPSFVASRLSTLAVQRNDELKALSRDQAAKWQKREALSWSRLSQPKKVLLGLAEENGLTIKNANRIPHDLWPRGDYPAMTLPERLTLFLAGFKLSYQFDSNDNLRLIRFPAAVAVERKYRVGSAGQSADISSAFPQADVKVADGEATVRTTVEEHAAIRELLSGRRPPSRSVVQQGTGLESKRFTLRIVDQPFVKVIKQLADQIGLELVIDKRVAINPRQQVSIDVNEVDIDQLMSSLLGQVGLKHERAGKNLTLLPN